MADNPKSLASLADEATERYYKSVSEYRSSEYSANAGYDFRAGWEAAAALRAPTIARPVTDEMVDAALTEYVGEPPLEDYFGEEGVGPHRLNMRAALEAALATPSPTIAAPSPSNEVTPEMTDAALRRLLEHAKTCPFSRDKAILYAGIDAARKQFEEFSKDESRGNEQYYAGMASGLAFALQEIDRARYDREAALKARKPEDDGAGQ